MRLPIAPVAECPNQSAALGERPPSGDLNDSVSRDGAINPKSAHNPNFDASGEDDGRQETERRHVCFLVIGPSGSGKSAFIASVSGTSKSDSNAMVGHGMDPCTMSCSAHNVTDPSSGTLLTLLDTPGFNDQSRNDLDILGEIATFLSSRSLPPLSAVIFTHDITQNRVTGSSRLNLEIAKALCGEAFYPRLALLTTMWNKIPNPETREMCCEREGQVLTSPALWGALKARGCPHARFDGTTPSGMDFLRQLLDLGQVTTNSCAFGQELLAGAKLEETKAGAIIRAEREKRQQQSKAELLEIQREEIETLQVERSRLQAFSQNSGGLSQQNPMMSRPNIDHASSGIGSVAYDRLATTLGRQQSQGRWQQTDHDQVLVESAGFWKECVYNVSLWLRKLAQGS